MFVAQTFSKNLGLYG